MDSKPGLQTPHIIFIGGMDLSGSTVVDLALGSLPKVVGLGEIDNILSSSKRTLGEQKNGPVRENLCSCQRIGSDCPVWAPILAFMDENPDSTYSERYRFAVGHVKSIHPTTEFVIDSSKEPQAFKRMRDAVTSIGRGQNSAFTLLVLRRGPLSWLVSDTKRAFRRSRTRNFRIRRRRLQKWTRRYQSLLSLTGQLPSQSFIVSLENFQQHPDLLASALRERFPASFSHEMSIDLKTTQSHVLWGSHHRHGPETRAVIKPQEREPIRRKWAEIVTTLLDVEALKVNQKLKSLEGSRNIR